MENESGKIKKHTKKERILIELRRATRHRSFFSLIFDVLIHKLLINADPRDYFRYGFYKQGKSLEEKSRYVSNLGSKYYPYENNPLKYNKIFTDKYIQKAILQHFNLPTARLLTTIGQGFEISNQKKFESFLDSLKGEIVIKPISGTHGTGLVILRKNGGVLSSGNGVRSVKDAWNHVSKNFHKGYLVEEKISNVDSIRAIHPPALNTFRFTMIKTADGKWHNASCTIKFGTGTSQVDNANAGGVVAEVDAGGKTIAAYDFLSAKPITHHPDSGYPLVGINLEGYPEAAQLAMACSRKFHFMGSIGWDIAASVKGPIIIEGNAWWGITSKQLSQGIITDELARGLKKRNLFTRWDKTRMHPRFSQGSWIDQIKKLSGSTV